MAFHRSPRRSHVALGVSGVLLLGFFSIVFMFSRPADFKFIEDSFHPINTAIHNNRISQKDLENKTTLVEQFVNTSPIDVANITHTNNTSGVDNLAPAVKLASKAPKTGATPSDNSAPSSSTSPNATSATVGPVNLTTPPSGTPPTTDNGLSDLDNMYKPTKEMISAIAQNDYLVVTWANHHYLDFVRTWLAHVRKTGITGYIVGAMDDELLKELIKMKANCFSMRSGLTLGDFGWGSSTFAKMGREKIRLIRTFLMLDVQVIIADVDVLFLRNPLPFFQQYPDADILTSSDSLFTTVAGEELEMFPKAGSAANIGIMLFRKRSLAFVEEWITIIEKDDKIWDQNAFNDLHRKNIVIPPPDSDLARQHLFKCYDGELTVGILPVSVFCSGHTLYTQHLARRMGLKPYAVHATFQFSGTPGKRHRMREEGWWEDLPEYYQPKGGLVSFEMDGLAPLLLPQRMPQTDMVAIAKIQYPTPANGSLAASLSPTALRELQNVRGHFDLVNHQLLRLRAGFAIASLLGRTLVAPQLVCASDRWWAPHYGLIPGTGDMPTPFTCPLDHVIDLEGGVFGKLDPHAMGPHIDIREHSFLANPRLPRSVIEDMILVEICPQGLSAAELEKLGCSDGTKPATVLNPATGATADVKVVRRRDLRSADSFEAAGANNGGQSAEQGQEKTGSGFKRVGSWRRLLDVESKNVASTAAQNASVSTSPALSSSTAPGNDATPVAAQAAADNKATAVILVANAVVTDSPGAAAAATNPTTSTVNSTQADAATNASALAPSNASINTAAVASNVGQGAGNQTKTEVAQVNGTATNGSVEPAVTATISGTPTVTSEPTLTTPAKASSEASTNTIVTVTPVAAATTTTPTVASNGAQKGGSGTQGKVAVPSTSGGVEDTPAAVAALHESVSVIPASSFRGMVRIAPNLDSARLAVALSSVHSASVLHFRTMLGAMQDFGLGFTDQEVKNRFMSRMRTYGSIWCCVHNHPGHVHYDLLWDAVPHIDRHSRLWTEPWVPVAGP